VSRTARCEKVTGLRVRDWRGLLGLGAETAETLRVLIFASGKAAEQVAVGEGAESFRAVAIVAQLGIRKDARFDQAVLPLQLVKCGPGQRQIPGSCGAGSPGIEI
jgi:hypothetical protein